MLLDQAWQEYLAEHPECRYQVFVQHPQNWSVKGWIAVFQDDGSDAALRRIACKADRLIGIFDHNVGQRQFYAICTYSCLAYRFRDEKTSCRIVDTAPAIGDPTIPWHNTVLKQSDK